MYNEASFVFKINGDNIIIRDLNQGGKSVTNDAKNVINNIVSAIGYDEVITKKIVYYDTDNQLDEMVPIWDNEKCIDVRFKIL